MIVDFFEHGTGEASGPLDYFLGKNRDREHAKILLGDVNEVAELIDCSPYDKRYTSGCLSFYESDLTEADKAQIMRDFEKTLFPGLTTGNYRILWVEHRDKINEETGERRLELNFLIPNIEIESGKRLQPFFAKADLDRVDAFKKIVNYEHDLFDPDDPLNRRSVKIAQNLPKESKEFKAQVHDEITLAICDDLIYDRKTLLDWCETVGFEVTKITKKQISIKNPETGRPEVFKGEFYEQNFRNTAKSTELKAEASGRYRQRAEKRYQTCIERHEQLCEQRANTILNDMETEIEKVETDLTQNLQNQKTEMQSKIGKVASSFNSNTQALNRDLQKQIQDMKLHLQTLQSLSQETIEQAKLKKALTLSIFPLILVLLILLISNMFLGYINKTNYKELNQIKTLQQTEQAKLAEVKQALSLSKAELQKKYPQIAFKD